jgi:methionyl-tRNA synthetase
MTHDRRVLIVGPNPTPNGDLHLGHIAGPYLAGDVYARYQRALGRHVVYTTGTDDSQTYVVAAARRLGRTPDALCRTASQQICQTLAAMGISVDGFGPFDDDYRATVLDFFSTLHAAGKFRLRTVQLPYLERTGEFIVEGLICGDCPVCLAESRGGLCETCGHPNNYNELFDSRSTIDPADVPTTREATILVLPLEEYREQLTAYHEARASLWRPHIVQLIREALARPLPDLPITYPLGWGIPAPFPQTPGQVLNAWAETIPAAMFTTAYCAAQRGLRPGPPGELWRQEHDLRLVHFLGFDNAFFWSLPYIALLMAHEGRYILPDTIVPNEFYELESEKFSTSKGHVVWCQDLLREVPRDLVRLYLASTAPEHQRTSFSRAGLEKIVGQRLAGPWNRLADWLGKAVADAARPDAALPVSAEARARAAVTLGRFDTCYEFPGFSLTRATDLIFTQLDRLQRSAARLEGYGIDDAPGEFGDLFLAAKTLLAAASPILIDLAEAARRASGFDISLARGAFDVTQVRPFAPPLLGGELVEFTDVNATAALGE